MSSDVVVQYFDGCPHWRAAYDLVERIVAGNPEISIRTEVIASSGDAEERGFRGSPTVLVNGKDPWFDQNAPIGLACRLYATPTGASGAPTEMMVRAALRNVSIN